MPVTRVGIAYSKSQQVIRRIVKVHVGLLDGLEVGPLPPHVIAAMDEDAEFAPHLDTLHPFEGWAFIPLPVYDSFTSHQQIHDHLGLAGIPTVSDKCMVVDADGLVIEVGCWDPWIDKHPGGRIIPNPRAEVGGTYINGAYNKPRRLALHTDAYRTLIAG